MKFRFFNNNVLYYAEMSLIGSTCNKIGVFGFGFSYGSFMLDELELFLAGFLFLLLRCAFIYQFG